MIKSENTDNKITPGNIWQIDRFVPVLKPNINKYRKMGIDSAEAQRQYSR